MASKRRDYDYGRTTVCKPGRLEPGPVMLQQMGDTQRLESTGSIRRAPTSPIFQVEAAKLAFADREKFTAIQVHGFPIATLLSEAYNDERRK